MGKGKDKENQEQPLELESAGFNSIDPEEEGEELGFTSGEKYEFNNVGQILLGVLTGKKQANIDDQPWCYQLHNKDGEFWFWGCTIIDSRLEEIDVGRVISIEYIGMQTPTAGKRPYKGYKVMTYPTPTAFDAKIHTVGFNADNSRIEFYNRLKVKKR